MYDELTAVDIQKMQEEINYRVRELRPQLIEEVQTARAFGDLSENYEYKCAKQAKNRNDSRIRYLERMIRTAKVIEVKETADAVGLFDTVTVQDSQQDCQTVLLQTYRHAARIRHHRVIDQRLNLHQQRTRSFPHHHHGAAGGHFISAT